MWYEALVIGIDLGQNTGQSQVRTFRESERQDYGRAPSQSFVNHRNIGFAANRIAEFALHH